MDLLTVQRNQTVRLDPDVTRVITKPFFPGDVVFADGPSRLHVVLERILAMPEAVVARTLGEAQASFAGRHRDLDAILDRAFAQVVDRLGPVGGDLTADRRRLIGAYFTHEYSIEGAALGNPSIVAAPDQSGVAPGAARFVMSLRAIGEGHVSSIEFRTGVVGADLSIALDPPSPYAVTGAREAHGFDKAFFASKLDDLGVLNDVEERVLRRLQDLFTMPELEQVIRDIAADDDDARSISGETIRLLHWLASSNYRVSFPSSIDISERVLFPSGPTESRGMEDARFVQFRDDDGAITYYATYTAFDGRQILPQLLETTDFVSFRVTTMSGHAAHNKGIALFPRRINGRFVALGRYDNVNNFVMTSSDIRTWNDPQVIQQPRHPWELMQLGNCGSPVETDAGWLVITHGVGPFRRYALGALLLDLDDPSVVLGHLDEPLLVPIEDEREGYVPNVVYSCGSMIHNGHLVLPYGYADVGARIATIPIGELLSRLTRAH